MPRLSPRLACLLTLATLMAGGPAVHAQEGAAPVRTERTQALREFVFKGLSRVRELADQGNTRAALEELDKLKSRGRLNDYEAAMAWNLDAYLNYQAENYRAAIDGYAKVLEQEQIPLSLRAGALYSTAQLKFLTDDFDGAAAALTEWFAVAEDPGADAYLFLAQIHYQRKDYKAAAASVEAAMRFARQKGRDIPENWYLLQRVVYWELKDYPKLLEALAALVKNYPKREYWLQLAAVYDELGRDAEYLAVMETAYDQGLLESEPDLVRLAQLYMEAEMPFKGARVLAEGMEAGVIEENPRNLGLLGDAWLLSKEYRRAIETLARARQVAPDPGLTLRMAQLQLELGDYAEAAETALEAAGSEELEDAGRAWVVRGLALYNLERFAPAEEAFRQAAAYEDTRELARKWVGFVQREQDRQARLAESSGS
ncbi:MAG: tetratricopeptide repeat protein [Gammaproteobacteria bacterium]